jgi:hypothetical protein
MRGEPFSLNNKTSSCGPPTKEPDGVRCAADCTLSEALTDHASAEQYTEGMEAPARRFLGTLAAGGFHPNTLQVKVFLLAVLCVAHFLFTFLYLAPGPLSVDEAIYHWMAKSFAEQGSLDIWNGYAEFPSPELRHRYIRAREGRLVPQYPSLFPVLALPFYRFFGFFGLFVMNALAFVGVVVVCFFTARKLFGDAELALDSSLILILATFAWEYSQAAWPHMCALLFAVGAFYLSIRAYFSRARTTSILLALASGTVAAAGLGFRLDGILVFPALLLPFIFSRPARLREALALLVGTLPAIAVLSAMNEAKFGVFSPFSYGEGRNVQTIPLLICVSAGVIVGLAWIATRPKPQEWVRNHRIALGWLASIAVVLSVVLVAGSWDVVHRVLRDGYVSVVDVRALPADRVVAERSSGGGVLYIGAHKKALLQSMPYLGLLLVPLMRMMRPDKDFFALATLSVAPLAVIAFYAYSFPFHDVGGLCLNTRYFLLALPFISILCAYAIKDLKHRWGIPFGYPVMALIAVATGGLYFVLTYDARGSMNALEYPILVAPLRMSIVFAALIAAGLALKSDWSKAIRAVTWVLFVMTITWAGILALLYDYPAHRHARAVHNFYGEACIKFIPPDSILFSDNKTYAASTKVIEKERVRLAFPPEDGFKDFPRLLDFQLRAGRRCFALFYDALWAQLQRGVLSTYRITPLIRLQNFTLAEIALQGVGTEAPAR